jgi:signal transduction histidine kinase
MGNATQVHQVLMNLCTNAAHAMEESGGSLNVSLKDVFLNKEGLLIGMKPGDYVEIKVSDTGSGDCT